MLIKKPKVKKGQTLLLHNTEFRRFSGGLSPIEVKVLNVGKKYFTLENIHSKFNIEDWTEVTAYTSHYALYESMQDFDDYQETLELRSFLREYIHGVNFWKVSLENLRQTKRILIANGTTS